MLLSCLSDRFLHAADADATVALNVAEAPVNHGVL
jgi:hypothetical protein